jgi:signal transduction histidine kinase
VQVRTDAARVLDSTARILRAEMQRHARFRIVLEGSPVVPMDATSLGQVIMNLLLNAAQAIGAEGGPDAEIVARIATQGDRATITVADTGPGIAPDTLPRIFDAYFTTKKEGTGLGLAIVRDLVERADGTLRAENRADGGALFTVDLPTVTYSTAPPPHA